MKREIVRVKEPDRATIAIVLCFLPVTLFAISAFCLSKTREQAHTKLVPIPRKRSYFCDVGGKVSARRARSAPSGSSAVKIRSVSAATLGAPSAAAPAAFAQITRAPSAAQSHAGIALIA